MSSFNIVTVLLILHMNTMGQEVITPRLLNNTVLVINSMKRVYSRGQGHNQALLHKTSDPQDNFEKYLEGQKHTSAQVPNIKYKKIVNFLYNFESSGLFWEVWSWAVKEEENRSTTKQTCLPLVDGNVHCCILHMYYFR